MTVRVKVTLFKPSGKYYTTEEWRIPANAIGPADMLRSPDFRRIGETGPVLVETQEPWGFPHLFPDLPSEGTFLVRDGTRWRVSNSWPTVRPASDGRERLEIVINPSEDS